MKNNYLYQGSYSDYDDDIGWNDFALRSYDAQVGRFWQCDPYDEFASGYTGMGNDPVNMVDPSGGSVVGNVLNVIKDVIPCPGSAAALISSATSTMLSLSVKNETEQKNRDEKMTSQRTKQYICKPQRSSQNFGLQKSCFLANARTAQLTEL